MDMLVLTTALIKKAEENAVSDGASSFLDLMYNAGTAAAQAICKKIACENKKITVVCGNGNNGGDGFVIAKYLYEIGANVTVVLAMGDPKTDTAKHYFSKLSPIKISTTLPDNQDIIIDAVFGIGLNRKPSNELEKLFEQINLKTAFKISVDIPSGVNADSGYVYSSAVKADLTITFIALKPCFMLPKGSDYCGEVLVCDIGIKPNEYAFKTNSKPILKQREHNSHKGTFGTALLICGSYGMAGAAILSALGALRSGVGIAKCVIGKNIYSAFTSSVPEAVCIPTNQTLKGGLSSCFVNIKKLTKNASSLLFGCGVGRYRSSAKILKNIIKYSNIPTVIDADGINLISCRIDLIKKSKAPLILTPHPAEMARLTKKTVQEVEQNRIEIACDFANKHNCVLVLKGANTIIAQPNGNFKVNINGNAGMATGGSGDVLAGIIVSLLAQGLSPFDAACAAVYLHSEAADKALAKRNMASLLPTDILQEL